MDEFDAFAKSIWPKYKQVALIELRKKLKQSLKNIPQLTKHEKDAAPKSLLDSTRLMDTFSNYVYFDLQIESLRKVKCLELTGRSED